MKNIYRQIPKNIYRQIPKKFMNSRISYTIDYKIYKPKYKFNNTLFLLSFCVWYGYSF